jgi:RNA polymerase sigma-70 factor (ECF subfamily)
MSERSVQVSQLLQQWVKGDQEALDGVAPVIYQELRRLAHYHLKSERAGHTLQSTALVNEAFIQLMGSQPTQLQNRAHFVAIASRLMRQILMQYARGHGRAPARPAGSRAA